MPQIKSASRNASKASRNSLALPNNLIEATPSIDKKEAAGEPAIDAMEVGPTMPMQGIHSKAWMAAIIPQIHGLLSVPPELRRKIYRCFFENNRPIIRPVKKGPKYINAASGEFLNADVVKFCGALLLASRQLYVDVVFLLYQESSFRFPSPYAINNYIKAIGHFKGELITSIHVSVTMSKDTSRRHLRSSKLPLSLFQTLSTLPSLENLCITFVIDSSIFHPHRIRIRYIDLAGRAFYKNGIYNHVGWHNWLQWTGAPWSMLKGLGKLATLGFKLDSRYSNDPLLHRKGLMRFAEVISEILTPDMPALQVEYLTV